MRLSATRELSDSVVRLLCGGFIGYVDEDHWTYVRSWGFDPGTTEYMEIVSVLDGKTVEAIRVDRDGNLVGSPYRGAPEQVARFVLEFGYSQTASRVHHGGWWWGKAISGTNLLHAATPTGPMPEVTTSLCAKRMKCLGPNRPTNDDAPLCPTCCVGIVDFVIARPSHRIAVIEEGID
jgi:hypothetical protein